MAVYFVRKNGRIKIGTSNWPEDRARNLNAELLATVPGAHEQERVLHKRFAAYALGREWFSPSPELTAFIRTVRSPLQVITDHHQAESQLLKEWAGADVVVRAEGILARTFGDAS